MQHVPELCENPEVTKEEKKKKVWQLSRHNSVEREYKAVRPVSQPARERPVAVHKTPCLERPLLLQQRDFVIHPPPVQQTVARAGVRSILKPYPRSRVLIMDPCIRSQASPVSHREAGESA